MEVHHCNSLKSPTNFCRANEWRAQNWFTVLERPYGKIEKLPRVVASFNENPLLDLIVFSKVFRRICRVNKWRAKNWITVLRRLYKIIAQPLVVVISSYTIPMLHNYESSIKCLGDSVVQMTESFGLLFRCEKVHYFTNLKPMKYLGNFVW